MLSVAPVRSAGGAATYFAKDDYYAGEHASEVSAWGGGGAAELGLAGEVDKATFENLLNGKLPDGEQVGDPERRRAGLDLTFSMPKSASILAYVAGDERLLSAHMLSVRETMAWVEKHFAEGRTYADNRKGDPVRTGNLTYAIFQHDTSRKLDPQAHLHVVIANLTKVGERWQAVHNDQLWKRNSIIGSVYHAALRTRIEALGYRTELSGKHGQFEIGGVTKSLIREFSQRRDDILAKAAELGRGADRPALLREITKRTRDDKINLEDREALRAEWRERAAGLGFDGKAVVAAAEERVGGVSAQRPGIEAARQLLSSAGELARQLRDWICPNDPLVTNGIGRLGMSHERLGAVNAEAVAGTFDDSANVLRAKPAIGFHQGDRHQRVAARDARQPVVFLRGGAGVEQYETGLDHRREHRARNSALRQRFDDQPEFERTGFGAAILFREGCGGPPHLRHFLPDADVEAISGLLEIADALLGQRPLRKRHRRVAQHDLIVIECDIHLSPQRGRPRPRVAMTLRVMSKPPAANWKYRWSRYSTSTSPSSCACGDFVRSGA